ncbi:sugar-binding domain-containing protein [Neobacillus sp. CF12]|uniref:glycoside hydrolase family 2 protein n=1 Tax=Neobacillus sp. CF12 TaxID=3055864 RepID=UPI0025A06570|nr:sugar-binding domain-containing protein [Neobacillus sp. CF12]MDM5330559.1 glycoside hydrolase family 2 TIM barrel-domain containing protein [Neobacillus sp. CF12]
MTNIIPRPEYPRPNFNRNEWLNLNGQWNFEFDDHNIGLREEWYVNHDYQQEIIVPYAFQSKLSGIHTNEFHDVVWYERTFMIPEKWQGKQIHLHFGAVDYRASVWVNGKVVASHEGGHTSFFTDITDTLMDGLNKVVVRVEDISTELEQPRGKQYWEKESKGIFYTRTTGIWQTVWLEPVNHSYIERVKLTPNIDTGEVTVEYLIQNRSEKQELEIEIYSQDLVVAKESRKVNLDQRKNKQVVLLKDFESGNGKLWSPEQPFLYTIKLCLKVDNEIVDKVESYFGMRKISINNGKIELNNKPYYMKLVLDQGYYPDSLLTAPTDEAIKRDIELTKEMGFNGVRKHQKVEEPRFLYWADHLGILVWGEMANCHTFTDKAIKRISSEWQDAIERDYNHPSIVAWVPINESWGVPLLKRDPRQANHLVSMYYLTKSLDQSRLVISNDGWEHTVSDVLTIHDYEGEKEVLKERYSRLENTLQFTPADRFLFVPSFHYKGEPIMVSEFGGIAYQKSEWQGWGYTSASNDQDFIERYYLVVSSLLESPLVQGFCYTQITDVEQEINGLLTYDRKPKVDLSIIREINEGKKFTFTVKD